MVDFAGINKRLELERGELVERVLFWAIPWANGKIMGRDKPEHEQSLINSVKALKAHRHALDCGENLAVTLPVEVETLEDEADLAAAEKALAAAEESVSLAQVMADLEIFDADLEGDEPMVPVVNALRDMVGNHDKMIGLQQGQIDHVLSVMKAGFFGLLFVAIGLFAICWFGK